MLSGYITPYRRRNLNSPGIFPGRRRPGAHLNTTVATGRGRNPWFAQWERTSVELTVGTPRRFSLRDQSLRCVYLLDTGRDKGPENQSSPGETTRLLVREPKPLMGPSSAWSRGHQTWPFEYGGLPTSPAQSLSGKLTQLRSRNLVGTVLSNSLRT